MSRVGDKPTGGVTGLNPTKVDERPKKDLVHVVEGGAKKLGHWLGIGQHKTPAPQAAVVDAPTKVDGSASFSKTGLSVHQLRAVMPSLSEARATSLLPYLNRAMAESNINTPKRAAAFLGQLAQESGELKYFQELASGSAYEGRRDLGNTQPGDGERYKGRGPIQLTGRKNYEAASAALGVDLVNHPELAARPDIGFRIAGWFWQKNGLNQLADKGDVTQISHRVNGGYNGLAARQQYTARAEAAVGAGLAGGPLSNGDTPIPRDEPPSHSYGISKGTSFANAGGQAERMVQAYADTGQLSAETLYMMILLALDSYTDDDANNDPDFASFAAAAGSDWKPGEPVPQDLKTEFVAQKLSADAKKNPGGLQGALTDFKAQVQAREADRAMMPTGTPSVDAEPR